VTRRAVAFAETEAEWRSLSAVPGIEVVAVTPETDALAAASGSPYTTVEDLVDHELLAAVGDADIDLAETLIGAVDLVLRRVLPAAPAGVSAAAYFHTLKGFLDALAARRAAALAALDRLDPERVACFRRGPYRITGLSLFHKPSRGLSDRLLALAAEARGLEIDWLHLPDSSGERPAEAPRSSPSGFPARARLVLGTLRRCLVAAPPPAAEAVPVAGPVLVHSIFADLGDDVVARWRELGGRELAYAELFPERDVTRRREQLAGLVEELREAFAADAGVRAVFRRDGIDTWTLAEPVFALIAAALLDLAAFAPVVERALAGVRGHVILTGGIEGRNYVVARTAAAAGTPVVSYHYGGFLGFSELPMHERYDLAWVDWFVCNGDGGARSFQTPSARVRWRPEVKRGRPVAIGSPWVDRLVAETRASAPATQADGPLRLMYVMSALVGDNRYLGYVFHPEIWYTRFQRRLVEACSGREVRLILKPPLATRYAQLPNPLLESELPPNVEILRERPLSEVLDEADVFILDSPSTPLLHLVATRKPFVLYADRRFFLLRPDAAALLRKRAPVAETEADFFATVDALLEHHSTGAQPTVNDEFLKAYGTHLGDGRSADRLAAFLRELADPKEGT
jgi:hypothetical protein